MIDMKCLTHKFRHNKEQGTLAIPAFDFCLDVMDFDFDYRELTTSGVDGQPFASILFSRSISLHVPRTSPHLTSSFLYFSLQARVDRSQFN